MLFGMADTRLAPECGQYTTGHFARETEMPERLLNIPILGAGGAVIAAAIGGDISVYGQCFHSTGLHGQTLGIPGDLTDARQAAPSDLPDVRQAVHDDAEECGNPLPGDNAIQAAQRTIETLAAYHSGACNVWSTEEGEVEITVPVDRIGRAMTLVCDNDGGLTCFVNIDGRMRRMKDYDADDAWLSSDFIPRALFDIASR